MAAHTVAHGMVAAIERFLQTYERSSLRDIYLVDIVPSTLTLLIQFLDDCALFSPEPQYCGIGE